MRQQHHCHSVVNICTALLAMSCMAPSAQTVYRCGNSYSDAPCTGASLLSINDSRTPAQKAQTDAATFQARTSAQQMEHERQALEKSAMSVSPPATRHKVDTSKRPSGDAASAPAGKAAKAAKKKQSEPAFFTAASTPDKKNKTSGGASD